MVNLFERFTVFAINLKGKTALWTNWMKSYEKTVNKIDL